MSLFGSLGALAFYLIDAIGEGIPASADPQRLRLALVATYLPLSILCRTKPALAARYYPWLMGTACMLYVAAACNVSYARYAAAPLAELFKGLQLTLLLCIVAIFSFSRLTALATTVVVFSSAIGTIVLVGAFASPRWFAACLGRCQLGHRQFVLLFVASWNQKA